MGYKKTASAYEFNYEYEFNLYLKLNYESLKSFKHATVAMGSFWFLSRKLSQLGARVHALISALPARVDQMAVSPCGTSSGARPNLRSRSVMNVVTKVPAVIGSHILSASFVTTFLPPTSGLNIFARKYVGPRARLP